MVGHLYRCEETNPCKKLTFTKPEGVRKRGRPPLRWMDAVEKDLCTLGIRGCKNIALHRSRWWGIVKAIQGLKRAVVPQKKKQSQPLYYVIKYTNSASFLTG
jgi:hypothetical protein